MTTSDDTDLTDRELHVLTRQAEGALLRELAAEMHMSIGGVGHITSSAIRKLGARNVTNAVLLACRAGLLDGRPQRHGDHAGYVAHKYRGEDPCKDCRKGENRYRAEQRKRARRAARAHAA